MKVMDKISKLCTPAMIYFILSAVSFLGMMMQNCTDSSKYKVGTMEVETPCHNGAFFAAKAAYILFFTWVLNTLCSKGFKTVSWALILLPFLGMFLAIGLVFIALLTGNKEGMDVPKNYGEQFEPNPRVEGNLPPIPSGAPKEGFYEGEESMCDEGYSKDASGKCVKESFAGREGFYEGAKNQCPDDEELDSNGECVPKQGAFTGMEGFEDTDMANQDEEEDTFTGNYREGMSAEDEEGFDDEEEEEGMGDEDDEGFVGGGNWPSVGQLL